jgi:uncharacterized protein (DUF779 family)
MFIAIVLACLVCLGTAATTSLNAEFRFNMIFFHFGKWGDDFRIWCHFVSFHPHITHTVVSDMTNFGDLEQEIPPNVRLVTMTLDQINDAAIQILDVQNATKPRLTLHYKVCDYRPLFGKIFKKVLDLDTDRSRGNSQRAYTHWGWGDFDVLLGTLEAEQFFPGGSSQYLLGQYDVIRTSVVVATNGPYSIMAYNERTVNLYKYISFAGLKNKKGMNSYLDTLYNWRTMADDERPFGLAIQNRSQEGALTVYNPATPLECNEMEALLWIGGRTFTVFKDFRMQECVYFHYGGGFSRSNKPSERKLFVRSRLEEFFKLGYNKRRTVGLYFLQPHADDREMYFIDYRAAEASGRLLRGGSVPAAATDFEVDALYEKLIAPFVASLGKWNVGFKNNNM